MIDIDIDSLESLPCPKREPEKYYIYFLLYNNEVVYVGKSVSVKARILAHLSDKLFDSYKYFELDTLDHKEVLKIERYHIDKYKPVFNNSTTSTLKNEEFMYDRCTNRILKKDVLYNDLTKVKNSISFEPLLDFKVFYDGKNKYCFRVVNHKDIYLSKDDKKLSPYTDDFKSSFKIIEKFLPKKENISNKESVYLFIKGKYTGQSYHKILKIDRSYIDWMIKNVPNYTTTMIKLQETKRYIAPIKEQVDKFLI
jgi:hypothetical protein